MIMLEIQPRTSQDKASRPFCGEAEADLPQFLLQPRKLAFEPSKYKASRRQSKKTKAPLGDGNMVAKGISYKAGLPVKKQKPR